MTTNPYIGSGTVALAAVPLGHTASTRVFLLHLD
jgi:hypothetical protein